MLSFIISSSYIYVELDYHSTSITKVSSSSSSSSTAVSLHLCTGVVASRRDDLERLDPLPLSDVQSRDLDAALLRRGAAADGPPEADPFARRAAAHGQQEALRVFHLNVVVPCQRINKYIDKKYIYMEGLHGRGDWGGGDERGGGGGGGGRG